VAKSICARCGEFAFEQATILHCTVIQCAKCGAVAGLMNGADVGKLLQIQDAKIDTITRQVERIDAGLRAIVEALNKR
jgi:hypothetical protein